MYKKPTKTGKQSKELDTDPFSDLQSDGELVVPITTPGGEEVVLISREAYDRLVALAKFRIEDVQPAHETTDAANAVPPHIAKRLAAGDEHPLKIWRECRGMSQTQLAATIGSTQPYIAQIEGRMAEGLTSTLMAAAAVLRVSVDDLIGKRQPSTTPLE